MNLSIFTCIFRIANILRGAFEFPPSVPQKVEVFFKILSSRSEILTISFNLHEKRTVLVKLEKLLKLTFCPQHMGVALSSFLLFIILNKARHDLQIKKFRFLLYCEQTSRISFSKFSCLRDIASTFGKPIMFLT